MGILTFQLQVSPPSVEGNTLRTILTTFVAYSEDDDHILFYAMRLPAIGDERRENQTAFVFHISSFIPVVIRNNIHANFINLSPIYFRRVASYR